jgi:hypothetical protein
MPKGYPTVLFSRGDGSLADGFAICPKGSLFADVLVALG